MGKFKCLEKAQLTADWSLEERAAVAHFLEEKKIQEGDPILLKQSKERALIFIASGVVRLQYEHLNFDLKEGDTFSELSIFQENQKLVVATAQSPCHLYFLSYESFAELRKVAPAVAVKLMESILKKLTTLLAGSLLPPRFFNPPKAPTGSLSHNTNPGTKNLNQL